MTSHDTVFATGNSLQDERYEFPKGFFVGNLEVPVPTVSVLSGFILHPLATRWVGFIYWACNYILQLWTPFFAVVENGPNWTFYGKSYQIQ